MWEGNLYLWKCECNEEPEQRRSSCYKFRKILCRSCCIDFITWKSSLTLEKDMTSHKSMINANLHEYELCARKKLIRVPGMRYDPICLIYEHNICGSISYAATPCNVCGKMDQFKLFCSQATKWWRNCQGSSRIV